MNRRLLIASLAALACCQTSCGPALPVMPTTQSRRAGPWRDTASQIKTGPYTIYYHGTAQPAAPSPPQQWSGTIRGDIFVESSTGDVTIPNGQLTVGPGNALSVTGVHRTTVVDSPAPR